MSEPLHTKYRPPDIDSVRGHGPIKRSLQSMLENESRPHAYIFAGPPGCGKTTFGRIIANAVRCDELDLTEIDAGADTGIDNVRELLATAALRPMYGPAKVYIFDEAHGLSLHSQRALLKSLEESPPQTYFVLCTSEPGKLLPALKESKGGRCVEFTVSRLPDFEIKELLYDICEKEELSTRPRKEIIQEVVNWSDGIPRKSLIQFSKVMKMKDKDLDEARALLQEGVMEEAPEFIEFANSLIGGRDAMEILTLFRNLPDRDYMKIRIGLANYFKSRLLNAKKPEMIANFAGLLQNFARPVNHEVGEAELVLDLYLAVTD